MKYTYFIEFFGRIKLGSHKETIPLFIVSIIGNLLPLLLGLLLFWSQGIWEGWFPFYGKGEFYIYNASFLTGAGFLFFTYKEKNYDVFSVLFYITILLAGTDSILYAFLLSGKTTPNIFFLRWVSAIIFFIAILLFYLANYMNFKKISLWQQEKKGIDKIKNQLP